MARKSKKTKIKAEVVEAAIAIEAAKGAGLKARFCRALSPNHNNMIVVEGPRITLRAWAAEYLGTDDDEFALLEDDAE